MFSSHNYHIKVFDNHELMAIMLSFKHLFNKFLLKLLFYSIIVVCDGLQVEACSLVPIEIKN